MKICAACRLRQDGGGRCASCGESALRALDDPALRVPQKRLRLSRFDFEELSYPAKFFLGLLFFVMMFGAPVPIALWIDSLTGSEQLAIFGMFAMLITPWVLAVTRPTLRWVDAGTKYQLSTIAPLSLPLPSSVRSGRVVSRGQTFLDPSGKPCLVLIMNARESGRLLEWESRSVELDVIDDSGARIRVAGLLTNHDGKVLATRWPRSLLREWRLPPDTEIALLRVGEGDRVEVRGTITRDQGASGYREPAEMEVMRGVPGRPVEIRLL